MVLVRRIRSRGANIVVEANGEVLFAPGTDLSRWKNRFSHRVREATIEAAPTNKRPRWGHYGRPLKATITASTATRISRGGGRFYIAVGSSAPHAYYVDQGTGVYAGKGPYEAKILPPWERGSPSLYEHTWRPGGPGTRKVRPVFIKGQRGQFFFDKGLKRGFESMRMRSFQVPGEGVSGLASSLASFPEGLANFVGNTPSDAAFRASLAEWRAWRDEAFARGDGLGRDEGAAHREAKATKKAAAKTKRAQAKARAKSTVKPQSKPKVDHKITAEEAAHKKRFAALRAEEKTLKEAIHAQFPGAKILDMRHGISDGQPYWFFSISRKGVTTNHKNVSHIR